MRALFILWCFFSSISLCAAPIPYEGTPDVAATEGLPSSIVNQSVSVISGEYTDSVVDFIVEGPEPLIIQRNYGNKSDGNLGNSWSFNHRDRLLLGEVIYEKDSALMVGLRQPSGAQLNYVFPKAKKARKKNHLEFELIVPKGLTNGATSLSGKTNLKNQSVHFYQNEDKIISISGAGDVRTFLKTEKDFNDMWPICVQKSEKKVNGSLYTYESKSKDLTSLSRIVCESQKTGKEYSHVKFKVVPQAEKPSLLELSASDGKVIKYHFKEHKFKTKEKTKTAANTAHYTQYYLTKVENSAAPEERYEYEEKHGSQELQIACKKRPEGRSVLTEYYRKGQNKVGGAAGIVKIEEEEDYRINRVKKQKAPVGPDRTPITTHRFVYHWTLGKNKELIEGKTDVYDALDHLTSYTYDDSLRLASITRFQGNASYSKDLFLWEKQGKQEGNLLAKYFLDHKANVHHAHLYTYDDHGNVIEKAFYGKLTGLSSSPILLDKSDRPIQKEYECEKKTYTYSDDGLNLPLSETDSNGKTILYKYIKETDHLKAKFVQYEGEIHLREFYFYDDHYVLIEKILDDGKTKDNDDLTGVTERHYTSITPTQEQPFGLPEIITEMALDLEYNQKVLLTRQHCFYSPEGHLVKQEVYNSNDELAYTLTWEYDPHGNVIEETNPLGEVITKKYDDNDNLILQKGATSYEIHNTYDFSNRLVSQEEIHPDGKRFVTTHNYDYLGNCIKTINPYGHETEQVFDDFGQVIETHYPPLCNELGELVHPVVKKTYDVAGYPISLTDAQGHTIHTEYNIRGQPTKITYPDNTIEQMAYQLDGQLTQKIEKNGTSTVYTRDPLGRITQEATYASDGTLLKKAQNSYNSLHLIQTTDPEGSITTYTYDCAGRVKTISQEGNFQKNTYNRLGHLVETKEWYGDQPHEFRITRRKHDLLGRVLEEHLETPDCIPQHSSFYAYDAKGNCILQQSGEQKTTTEYDTHDNPIKITNGLGNVTHIIYNTQYLNPHGQHVLQTITTDPLGYQTFHTYDTANRLVQTERRNPFGIKVSCQTIYYDLCGNQCRILDEVIQNNQTLRTIETISSYNEMNQLLQTIEAARTTEQKVTHVCYNTFGQKAAITKPDGNALCYEYDLLGRVKFLRANDQTILYQYEYNKNDQITRVEDLRTHRFTQRVYDKLGQLTQEKFESGLTLQYTFDKVGRATQVLLPDQTAIEYIYNAIDLKEIHRIKNGQRVYSHLDQSHNLSGQITKSQLAGLNGEITYAYNGIGNCTEIKTTKYHQYVPPDGFDKAGNLKCYYTQGEPHTFTYDDNYFLNSEPGHSYQYDSLSNRTNKDGEYHTHNSLNQIIHKGTEQFLYDPNGNLRCHVKNGIKTEYSYDGLDRLIGMSVNGKTVGYAYDAFNRRIFKVDQEGIAEVFLYQGQEEIGMWKEGAIQELRLLGKNPRSPMVALELKGHLYVPIHDLSGNVTYLLNYHGEVVERYKYTAFGESQILSPTGELLPHSSVNNPWRYASKRIDEETGLIAFGLRYYEPALARWLTPDPAGLSVGPNLYAYVHNNPLIYYDEFGLYDCPGFGQGFGKRICDCLYDGTGEIYCAFQDVNHRLFGEPKVKHINVEYLEERKYNLRQKLGAKLPPFERTATYSINDYINPDTNQHYDFPEIPGKRIFFVNGVWNNRQRFDESLLHIAEMANYNVRGVFCPTRGKFRDLRRYLRTIRNNIAYEGVRELQKEWHEFFRNAPADATCLVITHSRGNPETKLALMDFPPELRDRVEVIAIAPGGYIFPRLCHSIRHYESRGDPIPILDGAGRTRCKGTITTIDVAPGANRYFDHSFTSPTYNDALRQEIKKYLY